MRHRDDHPDAAWASAEIDELRLLPDRRDPSVHLRERTLRELRTRGLIGQRRASVGRRMVPFVIAASLAFVAGGVAGYGLAVSRAPRPIPASSPPVMAQPAGDTLAPESTVHVAWF